MSKIGWKKVKAEVKYLYTLSIYALLVVVVVAVESPQAPEDDSH